MIDPQALTSRLPGYGRPISQLPWIWPAQPAASIALAGLIGLLALLIALLSPPASLSLLAGLAVILVIAVRPWTGLPFLAIAIPFAAIRPLPLGGASFDGTDLLLAWIVAAWLAQGVARRHLVLPKAPMTLPLLLFLGGLLLSLPGAPSLREGLTESLKWVEVLVLYWLVVAILPPRRTGWLIAGLLFAASAQALLGIYQFITQSGPEPFVLFGRFMRAYGTFRQPNPYAGYLGLAAPPAISLALWAWINARHSISASAKITKSQALFLLKVALTSAAGLISFGLLISWSRGAWIAFAAALIIVVLAWSRRAAPLVLAAAGLALLAGLAFGLVDLLPASLAGRLGDLQDYFGLVDVYRVEVTDANFAIVERVAHWQAAIAMWADYPWFGVGLGNYAVVYLSYNVPRWYEALGHAHNVYLNFGAETGLVGMLGYLLFWGAAAWHALQGAAHRNRYMAAVGAGVLGALTHATIHNFFDNLWVQHMYLQIALLLGLLTVLASVDRQPTHAAHDD